MNIIWKILLAILGIIVISQFLTPLLTALFPPFGVIILIVLYVLVVAWLLGFVPFPI